MSINTSIQTGSSFPCPPQQRPYSYGRTEKGRWAKVPYEGLDQNQIDALAASADLAGLNYTVQLSDGAKSHLEIEYNYNFVAPFAPPATTEAASIWEIVPRNELIDLLDARNPLVQLALPVEVILLKDWKRNNQLTQNLTDQYGNFGGIKTGPGYNNEFTPFPQIPSPSGGVSTNFSNSGTVLCKFIYDGVTQVEIPAPTLTHTTTVASQYIYPENFNNVGLIISTATLISTEGVPTTVLFDFPNTPDPAPIPIGVTGLFQVLQYGWLKKSPSVRQVSNQKWVLTQTWDYGLWGIALYGGTRL